jgi:hypothetical protein
VYPSEVISLFDELGIDRGREAEIYHLGRLKTGLHHYGGWFHFIGQIDEEGKTIGPFDLEVSVIKDPASGMEKGWSYGEAGSGPFKLFFQKKLDLVPDCFQGFHLAQLQFSAWVPWVLEGSEPD